MERTVTMPKLGMTMEEGTVLGWRYKEGDWVEKDEALVEVMTDKVNLEVEAPFTGFLVHILAQEGDVLPVGAPIATFKDSKEETASPPALGSTSAQQNTRGESPGLSPDADASGGGQQGTLLRTSVASTPSAKREAATYGIDLQAVVRAGAKPPLNRADVTAFVQNGAGTSPSVVSLDNGLPSAAIVDETEPNRIAVRATPLAQKIAQEQRVDLATVAGRKPGEKVTRADIEAHLAGAANIPEQPQRSALAGDGQEATESELIPLAPVRRIIAQRMVQSITTTPHIYLDTEMDMTEAERCRQRVGRSIRDKGEPVPSLTALIVQAVAAALVSCPDVNAGLEPGALQGKDAIRRWRAVHIGIAVDTGQALLTPVIRNAQKQSLFELARELRRLALAAREGKLKPDELAGATFTISNLGMYGIDTFHAIIPPGQSAILATGNVTRRPVAVKEGDTERIEVRPLMKVSLSADHRVLDGASGSRFLQQFKTFLEDPYLLL
ncbi:MAG: dihydrolipoamide acetyltransferase family protein [Ktedonobacteraceae bacterium]